MQRIALIGPMGSGKTSVALQYKAKHGCCVLDTDEEFTARYGDISRYISANGEDAFRKIEHELVLQAVDSDAEIISCGGGVVLDKRNVNALRSRCDIVCLTAPVQTLKERIAYSDRPFKADIEKIVNDRAELYARYADYTIDTKSGDGVQKLSDALSRPRPNRYDILLCDADDTVLDFQKAMRTSIIAAARAVGVKSDEERIIKQFGEASAVVWRRLEDKQLELDKLDTLRFSMLKDLLGEEFDVSEMSDAFLNNLKKTRFLLNGATEFLSTVRKRGIKVYILTNGIARIAHERLKALDGYIDGAFISEEIGCYKPDPRLFDYVFDALGGVDKSRTLMFGDSVNSDIRGGINSGIDTCLFDPSGSKVCSADYSVRDYDGILRIL